MAVHRLVRLKIAHTACATGSPIPCGTAVVRKTRRPAIVLLHLFEIAFLRRGTFSIEALVAVALTGFHLRKHVIGRICQYFGVLRIEGALDQRVQEVSYIDVDFLVFLRSAVDRPDRVNNITRR